MQIGEKTVNEKEQLVALVKEGINPIEYIKNEKDIDFVSNAITHFTESEDTYFDDSAETLLKSFIYYVLYKDGESKTLARCKEIVELGLNDDNARETIENIVECDERSKALFKAIEIAPDRTFRSIFETLNNKLSEIL